MTTFYSSSFGLPTSDFLLNFFANLLFGFEIQDELTIFARNLRKHE
jgi:hypothetical protein